MRRGAVLLGLVACGSDERPADPYAEQTFSFGPVMIEPQSEDLSKCVALTIDNPEPLYVNQVVLETGPGFHHSNWLWVPGHVYPGEDGVFDCDERSYDQTAAGILGGVFFAQSTQATREVQQFPDGVALKLPPRTKLVAQIHLLNNGDEPLVLEPKLSFTPIPERDVTTLLSSVTFEYHPLSLPPRRPSRFSVECNIATRHQEAFGRAPDFKLYYALAHYHEHATAMTIEAVKDTGASAVIYSTENNVGDVLGGMLAPAFDFTGYSKLRLTCDYYNATDRTIYYGNGDGEMCIFNAFSDSTYMWAGGALDTSTGPGTEIDGVMSFTRDCQVYAVDDER